MLHPRNSSKLEPQILRYLTVRIQLEILIEFEFVPRNVSFSILQIAGVYHCQWNLRYAMSEIYDMNDTLSV